MATLIKRKKTVFFVLASVVLAILLIALFQGRVNIFADIESGSYELFAKPALEPVYPTTTPISKGKDSELIAPGGNLNAFLARGETEPVTFSVRSRQDLGQVKVELLSDLKNNENKVFSKNNIEILNIKTWEQCGPSANAGGDWFKYCYELEKSPGPGIARSPSAVQKYLVPELLVKDNEQDLRAAEVGFVKTPTANKSPGFYSPVVNKEFNAIIRKNFTHTFYLSVHAPADTAPGVYTGHVRFTPQEGFGQARSFNLNIEVLPFELPTPNKDIGVHITQGIASVGEVSYANIDEARYNKYLDVLREAGVTNLNLHFSENDEASFNKLNWLADTIKQKGFRSTLVWFVRSDIPQDIITRNLKIFADRGFNTYVYGIDEPNDPVKMQQHLIFSKKIHDAGGKVTTSLIKECSDQISQTEKIELPIYHIGNYSSKHGCSGTQSVSSYIAGMQNGSLSKNPLKEYYYYQIWPEQAPINTNATRTYWTKTSYIRAMTGFFLYKSGLDGVMPYGLDVVLTTRGKQEYNDFDGMDSQNRYSKDMRSIYRTNDGFIKTLQFESFREGIDDLRYATKFDEVITQLAAKDPGKAQSIKQEVNEKLTKYMMANNTSSSDPYQTVKSLTNKEEQSQRRFIAEKIMQINNILNAPQSITTYNFTSGSFKPFGVTSEMLSTGLVEKGLSVYDYDGQDWVIASSAVAGQFPIKPYKGYFILNSSQALSVELPILNSPDKYDLHKGWNLLFAPKKITKEELQMSLSGIKRSLNDWIDLGYISDRIFIIENEATSDLCNYFTILGGSETYACESGRTFANKEAINSGKLFWIFVR